MSLRANAVSAAISGMRNEQLPYLLHAGDCRGLRPRNDGKTVCPRNDGWGTVSLRSAERVARTPRALASMALVPVAISAMEHVMLLSHVGDCFATLAMTLYTIGNMRPYTAPISFTPSPATVFPITYAFSPSAFAALTTSAAAS